MKDLTTVELVLLSMGLELAMQDKSSERFVHIHTDLKNRINKEIEGRGVDDFVDCIKTMSDIEPDLKEGVQSLKKAFQKIGEMGDKIKV